MRAGNCMRYYGTTNNTPAHQAPPVWRAPEGLEDLTAAQVGGGRAWPGFETTRRAQLAARTASGRAATHRHTQRPSPTKQATRRQGLAGLRDRPLRAQLAARTASGQGAAPPVWRTPGARPRCRWAVAGPGRASRSTTPSEARVWRSRGRGAAHRHQHAGRHAGTNTQPQIHRYNEAARPHRGRAAHASGR